MLASACLWEANMTSPLSGSEFMDLACDQVLLSRSDGDRRLDVYQGEWPSAEARAHALAQEAHWLYPLAAAFVQIVLEACLARYRERPGGGPSLAFGDASLRNELERRLPLYQSWYVGWTVHHVERAFRHSPKLDGVAVSASGTSSYRFSRDHRGVFVEFVPSGRG